MHANSQGHRDDRNYNQNDRQGMSGRGGREDWQDRSMGGRHEHDDRDRAGWDRGGQDRFGGQDRSMHQGSQWNQGSQGFGD